MKTYQVLGSLLKKFGIEKLEEIDEQIKEKLIEECGGRFHKKSLEDTINGYKSVKPGYDGEVWVVCEQHQGNIHPSTLELVGKARELADALEKEVGVVVAGTGIETLSEKLIAGGADKVYLLEHELLKDFDAGAYSKVISEVIVKHKPQIVLYGATPLGRMLAPMISYRCGCGLTADCTGLDIRDSSRRGLIGILMQTRPALGGNIMARICTKDSSIQMATARPGVMKAFKPDSNRSGTVIREEVKVNEDDISLEIIRRERCDEGINIEADVIVSGGKGMQNRDNYEQIVGSLCGVLKKHLGVSVERGGSRAAIERGFAERVHQIGQTGSTVSPDLYIALGISGAIQHMIGISRAGNIIAINSDPNAPILKQCDYYLIGRVEEKVPELIKYLETR